jgi:hypothetical protein
METFLQLVFLCFMAFSLNSIFVTIAKIRELEAQVELLLQKTNEIHRTMLALQEPIEPTKPIKPNNWDSIKKAFKGPVKIEG